MVTAKDKAGHTIYITYIKDCGDNANGFYCETYSDEDCGHKIDDFCIHPEDILFFDIMNYKERIEAVELYITQYYKNYTLDLNYNF